MKTRIFLILAAIMLILGGLTYGIISYDYSKGVRSGKLVKLSKKGVILKTYEGTLDLGSGDMLTWNFSVHDSEVGEQLQKASGQMVKLNYREMFFKLFYETKYEVTSWEIVEDKSANKLLCRLVKILVKNKFVVERVRPMIEATDPELLTLMRECQ